LENMTWKNQKGVTLIELLVAMGLSLIVLGAGYSVFRVQTHTVKAQEFKMEAQEDARAALDMMVREVRNLGFFPTLTACTTVPANNNGIITAAANNFRFVYDANGDGDCADANPAENIIYSYTGTNITRDINDGNGPQILTAGNVTAAAFTYRDAAGAVTADLASIRRVSITLTVRSRSTDVQFSGGVPQDIRMDSNVDLRNRGNG
jgi:prepilin-type N-terminal cleavage/methylation domain-containing protein